MEPYLQFQRNLWWDVVVTPPEREPEEFRQLLQEMCTDSVDLLAQALRPHVRATACARCPGADCEALYRDLFTAEFVGQMVGACEQNQIGIRMPSPVAAYFQALGRCGIGEDGDAALNDIARAVVEVEPGSEGEGEEEEETGEGDEGVGEAEAEAEAGDEEAETYLQYAIQNAHRVFPPLDGQGLFSVACLMNHACDANVQVQYPDGGAQPLRARVVAQRDIAADEELSLCYLHGEHLDEPWQRRQELLADYGFVCCCGRCERERGNA